MRVRGWLHFAAVLASIQVLGMYRTGDSTWVVDPSPVAGIALPDTFVNVEYTVPTGCTEIDVGVLPTGDCKEITVDSGQNFQTALNDARRGDIIELGCSATFTGTFTLPSKTGTGRVYIQPNDDCINDLPVRGNRIYPDDKTGDCDDSDGLPCLTGTTPVTANFDVSTMPTIVAAGDPHVAFDMAADADGYVLRGFRIKPATNTRSQVLIKTYAGEGPTTNSGDIIFDQLYIPADTAQGGGRAISFFGCDDCAVTNSYISGWWDNDTDTQAILICPYSDNIALINNYTEASGENIFSDLCGVTDAVNNPRDIEIRWNLTQKPNDWILNVGAGWNNYKNLLETKSTIRMLVEGNIFRNYYSYNAATSTRAGQETAINIKLGDEDNDNYVEDIIIRKNLFYRLANAVKLCMAGCNVGTVLVGKDYLLYNNVAEVNGDVWGENDDADGYFIYSIGAGGINFLMVNNTALTQDGSLMGTASNFSPSNTGTGVFSNNIGNDGGNPFTTSEANTAFPDGYTYVCNVLIGGTAGNHPANQAGFPAAYANVGFVNYNGGVGGDYELDGSSSFKGDCLDTYAIGTTDPGANVDIVTNAVSCVITGNCSAWTPPMPRPRPRPAPILYSLRRPR